MVRANTLSPLCILYLNVRCVYPHRTNTRTPGRETDSPLPPIHERLGYLRPSRELLEYYRKKVAQFDGEHEELLQMLEKYKGITDDQVRHSHESDAAFHLRHSLFTCSNMSPLRPGYLSSINCSGRFASARGRLRSCRTLWVTCRSTFSKRENSLCGCTQKMTG